jgi:hypothetical protein
VDALRGAERVTAKSAGVPSVSDHHRKAAAAQQTRMAAGTPACTATPPPRMDDDAGSHARRTSARDLVQRSSSSEHSHRAGMERGQGGASSPSSPLTHRGGNIGSGRGE